MRAHDYLIDGGLDFSELDGRIAAMLDRSVSWLGPDDVRRARLGLHELLVNIRRHAYGGGAGPISIGLTTTTLGVTITATDWGTPLTATDRPSLPRLSETGGYGMTIIDSVFNEVEYVRISGRNEWVLFLFAPELAAR